jgi:hypothetical protein
MGTGLNFWWIIKLSGLNKTKERKKEWIDFFVYEGHNP